MRFGNFTRLRLQEEKSRGGVRPVPHSVELTLEASAAEVADAEAGDRVRPQNGVFFWGCFRIFLIIPKN